MLARALSKRNEFELLGLDNRIRKEKDLKCVIWQIEQIVVSLFCFNLSRWCELKRELHVITLSRVHEVSTRPVPAPAPTAFPRHTTVIPPLKPHLKEEKKKKNVSKIYIFASNNNLCFDHTQEKATIFHL